MSAAPRYSLISILDHWLTALLVVAMFVLGTLGRFAPDDGTEHYVMGIHVALGFFVFLLVAWRIGWRIREGFPPPVAGTGRVEHLLGRTAHILLLVLLATLVISGPLYLFTEDEAIDVFGWFSVGIPLGGMEFAHEPAESIHKLVGVWLLPILVVAHFVGAIVHIRRRNEASIADL